MKKQSNIDPEKNNPAGEDKEQLPPIPGNEQLTVGEMELVNLEIISATDLGYLVKVNGKHTGLMHYNELFRNYQSGEQLKGFVKAIRENNKLDVLPGKPVFAKVEGEARKILSLLAERNGFLPFNDHSTPEDIYEQFGMSKKTFKMSLGTLYRQKLITMNEKGISLAQSEDKIKS